MHSTEICIGESSVVAAVKSHRNFERTLKNRSLDLALARPPFKTQSSLMRIDGDEFLNTVALYLPHYDEDGLKKVVDKLTTPDPFSLPPVEVERGEDLVTLRRREGCGDPVHRARGGIDPPEVGQEVRRTPDEARALPDQGQGDLCKRAVHRSGNG